MPNLVGGTLQGLRWQGFVVSGQSVPGAGLLYLCVADVWYRLAIDQGTVHWHRESKEPTTWSVPEQGWEYPIGEIAGAEMFVGQRVASASVSGQGEHVRVEIEVDNGHKLVMTGRGEESSVHAA